MNFPGRKVRAPETASEEPPRMLHREIEITVERTWVSVGYPTQSAEPPLVSADTEPEILPPERPQ